MSELESLIEEKIEKKLVLDYFGYEVYQFNRYDDFVKYKGFFWKRKEVLRIKKEDMKWEKLTFTAEAFQRVLTKVTPFTVKREVYVYANKEYKIVLYRC